jgi:hypothetical protein
MTEEQLFLHLNSDAAITSIVFERVNNGHLPEGTPLPAVTFTPVYETPINTNQGDTLHGRTRYTINAWSNDYTELQQLKIAITQSMKSHVRLSTVPLHEPENGIYRIGIDYSIYN